MRFVSAFMLVLATGFVYPADPPPPLKIGTIYILRNGIIPEKLVLVIAGFKPGDPLAFANILPAQQRLQNLLPGRPTITVIEDDGPKRDLIIDFEK